MIVKGGYIEGTNSCRMHPVKNVIVKNTKAWTRITVKALDDSVTVCNIGFNYIIKMTTSDDGVMVKINEKNYFEHPTLFEFKVEIDTDDMSVVEFKDDNLYDG
jgi:hypothetical protein